MMSDKRTRIGRPPISKKSQVTIRIDNQLKDRLIADAKRYGVTRIEIIEEGVRRELDRLEKIATKP